jgi:hypothetical protein
MNLIGGADVRAHEASVSGTECLAVELEPGLRRVARHAANYCFVPDLNKWAINRFRTAGLEWVVACVDVGTFKLPVMNVALRRKLGISPRDEKAPDAHEVELKVRSCSVPAWSYELLVQ